MFPDAPMLKEEAMLVKEKRSKDELATLTASNGWLEKFKQTYGLRETRIIKYVVSQIDEGKNTSEIIEYVNFAKAIHWLQVA